MILYRWLDGTVGFVLRLRGREEREWKAWEEWRTEEFGVVGAEGDGEPVMITDGDIAPLLPQFSYESPSDIQAWWRAQELESLLVMAAPSTVDGGGFT